MLSRGEAVSEKLLVVFRKRLRSFEEIQHFYSDFRVCGVSTECAYCKGCRLERRGKGRFGQSFEFIHTFRENRKSKGLLFLLCCGCCRLHSSFGRPAGGFFQIVKYTHTAPPKYHQGNCPAR